MLLFTKLFLINIKPKLRSFFNLYQFKSRTLWNRGFWCDSPGLRTLAIHRDHQCESEYVRVYNNKTQRKLAAAVSRTCWPGGASSIFLIQSAVLSKSCPCLCALRHFQNVSPPNRPWCLSIEQFCDKRLYCRAASCLIVSDAFRSTQSIYQFGCNSYRTKMHILTRTVS